jgi:hypothetical protein
MDTDIQKDGASNHCVFQKCIQYAADAGFPEAGKLAQQLNGAIELNTEQVVRLTNIVGHEVIQTPSTASVAQQ